MSQRVRMLGVGWLLLPFAYCGLMRGQDVAPTDVEVNTFSIVAFDPERQEWGVAVASKYLAVGSAVPWAKAGVGAVATQAQVNVAHGPRGLELMAKGMSAEEALKALQDSDKQIQVRQLGLVDAKGKAAAFTGTKCTLMPGTRRVKTTLAKGTFLPARQWSTTWPRRLRKPRDRSPGG